jgi:hypothetical protein
MAAKTCEDFLLLWKAQNCDLEQDCPSAYQVWDAAIESAEALKPSHNTRGDEARITRYINHYGFMLQNEDGDYVKYDQVTPYIKEPGQPDLQQLKAKIAAIASEIISLSRSDIYNGELCELTDKLRQLSAV